MIEFPSLRLISYLNVMKNKSLREKDEGGMQNNINSNKIKQAIENAKKELKEIYLRDDNMYCSCINSRNNMSMSLFRSSSYMGNAWCYECDGKRNYDWLIRQYLCFYYRLYLRSERY